MPGSPVQLIVGLGNPGSTYAQTRHNIGSKLVEQLAQQQSIILHAQAKFHGIYNNFKSANQLIHLLIPTTFMNLSGQAVAAVSRFYQIKPENILIVHDELDLPLGQLRLKYGGGRAGHNGLRDIITHLATADFYRLRIGIGHPGRRDLVYDYVLSVPNKSETLELEQSIDYALTLFPHLFAGELAKFQQLL